MLSPNKIVPKLLINQFQPKSNGELMIVVGSTLFAESYYNLSFNSAFYFPSNKAIELLKPV